MMVIYMYIAPGQGRQSPRANLFTKILIFASFGHLLQVFSN